MIYSGLVLLVRTFSTDQEGQVWTKLDHMSAITEKQNYKSKVQKMGIWSEWKMIRPVNTSDCAALAEIYNHYILNTSITFEASNIKKGKKNQTIK